MTTPCLLLRDPDVVKNILIKDFDLFEDRGIAFSEEALGANLFHADAETWRVLRHQFTPLFTTGKLKNMLHLITDRGATFVDYLTTVTAKTPEQEAHKLMQLFTITSISACAFGIDVDITRDKTFLERLDRIDKLIFTRYFVHEVDMMYPGLLKLLNMSLFPKELVDFFGDLVRSVIKERKGMPSNRNDFMDLILKLKKEGNTSGPKTNNYTKDLSLEITEDIIIGQAAAFFSAGYETSATSLAYLLYELALHQDIQDKAVAEIDTVLKNCNGNITYDTLTQLPYMEKVFDETLRKYPIADALQRVAKIDYKIPGTNVTIEKGTTVLISVMGLHHDKNLYPNPEVFDPERFDPAVAAERHACAFIPFGAGPRNCIGMRFAKVQSRVCLLTLLSHFRIEPTDTLKEIMYDPNRLGFAPIGGIKLNFIPRK